MKVAHNSGERPTQTFARPINDTDIPVVLASRLGIKLAPVDIQHRVDNISKQFIGAGWKNLPQELIDEILGYLRGDLLALKTCSLTCKHLFGATRPLIHRRLVCLGSIPEPVEPKRPLFSRRKKDPGVFEQLIDKDRFGVLRYTQHLTLKPSNMSSCPRYNTGDIREYLPHLRSITELHTLTLVDFYVPPFTPVFNKYFGMFTNTLRHLDIRHPDGVYRALLYIISQFPLLEDLTIISPPDQPFPHPGHSIPAIRQSPPLRGKLVLAKARSGELSDGLATFPGGLNFRSLALSWCEHPQALLAACGRTTTSISYLFRSGDDVSESNSSAQVDIAM